MEWVAIPFSRGPSRPRDWIWISSIANTFSTVWATRKAIHILMVSYSAGIFSTLLYLYKYIHSTLYESESCLLVSDSLRPHGLCLWNSSGQNPGVDNHFLLQGIFPTQGLNQVSCIAGRCFTSWTTREAQEYRVGSLSLLQQIFSTQELNWDLLHCRQTLYQLSYQGSPRILEWVAYPFCNRSSQPRNWTRISCIAGRFFTSWATREAPVFYIPIVYLY